MVCASATIMPLPLHTSLHICSDELADVQAADAIDGRCACWPEYLAPQMSTPQLARSVWYHGAIMADTCTVYCILEGSWSRTMVLDVLPCFPMQVTSNLD